LGGLEAKKKKTKCRSLKSQWILFLFPSSNDILARDCFFAYVSVVNWMTGEVQEISYDQAEIPILVYPETLIPQEKASKAQSFIKEQILEAKNII